MWIVLDVEVRSISMLYDCGLCMCLPLKMFSYLLLLFKKTNALLYLMQFCAVYTRNINIEVS